MRTNVYLSGFIDMPNGSSLFAEDVDITVDYSLHRGDNPRVADVDFEVVEVVGPFRAFDMLRDDEYILDLPATHPAIKALVKRSSAHIEDACIDDASLAEV